jgi:hypothetical protein
MHPQPTDDAGGKKPDGKEGRVAALYVATNGCYFGLPEVEPWDVTRGARQHVADPTDEAGA